MKNVRGITAVLVTADPTVVGSYKQTYCLHFRILRRVVTWFMLHRGPFQQAGVAGAATMKARTLPTNIKAGVGRMNLSQ